MSEILGTVVLENGRLAPIGEMTAFPGNSIYEVIRVVEGRPVFLKDHLERLYRSLELAGRRFVPESDQLMADMATLIEANQAKNVNLRLVYVPLQEGFDVHMYLIPTQVPDPTVVMEGASLATYHIDRENPNIKTVSQSFKDLLLAEPFRGKFELLLVDGQGWIREGSKTNVFFIVDHKLVTPPAKDVLPGITRKKVLEVCREEGIEVEEGYVAIRDLDRVSALFLTGTSIGVLPVKQVDDTIFDVEHPILRILQEGYRRKEVSDRQEQDAQAFEKP
jgi:branched-chain amino acid aminotransferase